MDHRTFSERADRLLGPLEARYQLATTIEHVPPDRNHAFRRLESAEFVVDLLHDRGDEWIVVGSKIRPGARKRFRSRPLGHVLAFLDGLPSPLGLTNLETESRWLDERAEAVLDSTLLNSEALRLWVLKATRQPLDHKTRG